MYQVKDDLDKDGAIQRIEFTFELFWKVLRLILLDQGIEVKTPKSSIKEAFRVGIIEDEHYLNMLYDRNKSSLIYEEAKSPEIFDNINTIYLSLLEKARDKFQEFK